MVNHLTAKISRCGLGQLTCVKNCNGPLLNASYVYVCRDIVSKTYFLILLFLVHVKGQNSISELTGCNLTFDPLITFYYECV